MKGLHKGYFGVNLPARFDDSSQLLTNSYGISQVFKNILNNQTVEARILKRQLMSIRNYTYIWAI